MWKGNKHLYFEPNARWGFHGSIPPQYYTASQPRRPRTKQVKNRTECGSNDLVFDSLTLG